jgi:hypothetical protein
MAAFLLFGTVSAAPAAYWGAAVEEPRWFRAWIDELYAKLDVEGQRESFEIQGVTSRNDYLLVVPVLGVGVHGSVYHPNLVEFQLKAEGGPSWQAITLDPPGGTNRDTSFLQFYHGEVAFLRAKPYATSLFAEEGISYRDFDFFNRGRVHTERYGGDTGYADRSAATHLTYFHLSEDVTGLSFGNSNTDEDTVTLTGRTSRRNGSTEYSYRWHEYHREQQGTPDVSGVEYSANLFDTETWGKGDRNTLRSMLLYYQLENDTIGPLVASRSVSKVLTLREDLESKHSKDLSSNYRYSFDRRISGTADSDLQEAGIRVRHHLYESLTSVAGVHGSLQRAESPGATFRDTILGAGVDESYTKRIAGDGRLSLAYGVLLDREWRESTGLVLTIVDEAHVLTDGVPTFLNQPDVVFVGLVTDPTGIPYTVTLDYQILRQGARTEIQRVPGGRIPNGGSVAVDYTAAAPPSDDFWTLYQSARARLDLFGRLLGIYGRLNYITNYGASGSLILRDVRDTVVGAELSWWWFRAGAEYEDYASNISPYRAARMYQSVALQSSDLSSSLTLDFAESRTDNLDSGFTQRYLSFIGQYRVKVAYPLYFALEGGARRVRGVGVDQDQSAVRASLDYVMGQLTANVSYEYLDDLYLEQRHLKNNFFLRIKRTF